MERNPARSNRLDWGREKLDIKQIEYAAGDVVATWLLHIEQMKLVENSKRTPHEECEWIYNLMRSSIRAVNEVMVNGIGFDAASHIKLCSDMDNADVSGKQKALELFGSHGADGAPIVENPASTIQVANWLRFHLMLREPYQQTTGPRQTQAS